MAIFKVVNPNLKHLHISSTVNPSVNSSTEYSFIQKVLMQDGYLFDNEESIVCNYNLDEILRVCDCLSNIDIKITYLEFIRKKYLQNKSDLKVDNSSEEIPFDEKLNLEIEYLKRIKSNLKEKDFLDRNQVWNIYVYESIQDNEIIKFVNNQLSLLNDIPEKILYITNAIQGFHLVINELKSAQKNLKEFFTKGIKKIEKEDTNFKVSSIDSLIDSPEFSLQDYSTLMTHQGARHLYHFINKYNNVKNNLIEIDRAISNLENVQELLLKDVNPTEVIESGKGKENKIKWFGAETTLTYLIEKMKEKKWITKHNTFAIFSEHFCKEDGKEFNFHATKQNYQANNSKSLQEKGKPKNAEEIESLIQEAEKFQKPQK